MKFVVLFILSLTITLNASQECGKTVGNSVNFPWNVGIYVETNRNELELTCLGSIIKSKAILTAAHCVCDNLNDHIRNVTFYVVHGNFQKNIKINDKDLTIEKIKADNIKISSSFHGFLDFYANDLAIIELTTGYHFNNNIRPICIDWSNLKKFDNDNGKLVTWKNNGVTGEEQIFLDNDQCYYSVSENFQNFVTNDKFCMKSKSKSKTTHESSGGGYILFDPSSSSWFMRGILSSFDGSSPEILTATNIKQFLDWISKKTALL